MNRFKKLYEENASWRWRSPELDKIFQAIEKGEFSNAESILWKWWWVNKRVGVILEWNTGIMILNPSTEDLIQWKKYLISTNCL